MANNSLTRSDPFAGLTNMHSLVDDMFNSFFNTSSMPSLVSGLPAMDVYTDDNKQLVAEVHAPGFTKDDLDIRVHDNILEIKAEKRSKEEDKTDKRKYMVRESHARFYRSVALPKQADQDKVSAEFEDGVLRVTVPFKELPEPKRIAIGGGKK